jgi:nicotinamide-nucleotide amidase
MDATITLADSAKQLGDALKKRNLTLATAESCTGGGLSFWITSIPGSSFWFDRGFVTYTDAAKVEMLDVKPDTLTAFGAVSREVAKEMADGALKASHADLAIAITGIAGPTGGSKEKPVGTVWFAAVGYDLQLGPAMQVFSGDRQSVREEAIRYAIDYLMRGLDKQGTYT